MEQSLILLLIGTGTIATILLLYYSFRISSYCCLENTINVRLVSYNVVKPPRWSRSLASKIEYIDDTALEVVRERIEHVEKLVVEKLGAVALVSRDEDLYTTLVLKLKFATTLSKKIGIPGTLKLLFDLIYLRRLYKKASKLSSMDEKKQEYHNIIERILEHIDHVATRLEALRE